MLFLKIWLHIHVYELWLYHFIPLDEKKQPTTRKKNILPLAIRKNGATCSQAPEPEKLSFFPIITPMSRYKDPGCHICLFPRVFVVDIMLTCYFCNLNDGQVTWHIVFVVLSELSVPFWWKVWVNATESEPCDHMSWHVGFNNLGGSCAKTPKLLIWSWASLFGWEQKW